MISVDEHLDWVLAQVEPVATVTLPVRRAQSLVTTTDVHSSVDLPRFDNSSMDGYAVRRADLEGASSENPVVLPVAGDVAAGDQERHALAPGQVWRIMTGAPMPEGADAVVKVEDTDGHPHEPQLRVHPDEGAHIRRAGEDVKAGDLVLPAGSRIGPGEIAALLSSGVSEIEVVGPVRVAILSTGDELVPAGEPVGPGQIIDSNGPMLEALVREAGAYVVHVGHLPDDEGAIKKQLHRLLDHADLVITTGGVSKGEFDLVKKVLSGQGSMEFVEVAMQPGKPQGFGVLGRRDVPVFTLPGNPVSTLVSFEVFVRPALQRRAGRSEGGRLATGFATEGWRSSPERQTYTRVRIDRDPTGKYAVSPAGGAGSHLVGPLAVADALAVSDPKAAEVTAGSEVDLLLLRPRSEIDARLHAEDDDHDEEG
ncbi:Molybdopterin biosynthesis protein MoeA [Serinicoccus hydrothermalis]|uniref:Molybdopterin molybdenumtransferase n=1 Tax=Serinicoccus hydrothermalis TaxID=1758689 RepID=A0A1B1NBK2_9MICO|nr:gephyrin-like molybdotransferase Glp [Serinicoccus hydrothermalis]ANS78774.1 Molybdopterin biosynthesis protein MoeA [Serinicoccus hydrothermalis]